MVLSIGIRHFQISLICLFYGSEEPRTTAAPPPRVTVRPSSTRGRPFLPTRARTSTSAVATTTARTVVPSSAVPSRKTADTAELPAVVRETAQRRPTIGLSSKTPQSHPSFVDGNDHPQDNEISGSGVDNAQAKIGTGVPEPSGPFRVDRADSPIHQSRFSWAAIIGLSVIAIIVALAIIISSVFFFIHR